jgi:hypothetical protein
LRNDKNERLPFKPLGGIPQGTQRYSELLDDLRLSQELTGLERSVKDSGAKLLVCFVSFDRHGISGEWSWFIFNL